MKCWSGVVHYNLLSSKVIGQCVTEKKVLNIVDAHNHATFDDTIENLTGYVVGSMLCLPIMHMREESVCIGAIQASLSVSLFRLLVPLSCVSRSHVVTVRYGDLAERGREREIIRWSSWGGEA